MTGKRYLLDCTLRDGGYINDWAFGHDHIVNIFERVIASGVDVIEIGFLDERRVFDPDRSIMPDTQSVRKIYGGLDRKQAAVVGMIDFGTCGISHVEMTNCGKRRPWPTRSGPSPCPWWIPTACWIRRD